MFYIKKYLLLAYSFLRNYICVPIIVWHIQLRCRKNTPLYYRFIRMHSYIKKKVSKENYKRSMEAVVQMSEDFGLPQHEIIRRLEQSGRSLNQKIRYKSKNGKLYGNLTQ